MNCSHSLAITSQEGQVEKIDLVQRFKDANKINIPKGTQLLVPDLNTTIPNARACMELKHDRLEKKVCSDDFLLQDLQLAFDEDTDALLTCDCPDASFTFEAEKGCVPIEANGEGNDDVSAVKDHAEKLEKERKQLSDSYDMSRDQVELLSKQLKDAISDMEKKEAAKVKAAAASTAANERVRLTDLKKKQNLNMIITSIAILFTILAIGVSYWFYRNGVVVKKKK